MSFTLQGPLLLAGAGKMGGAVLSGLLARGLKPERILVQDPAPSAEMAALLAKHGIRCAPAIDALREPPSIILLAVKPEVLDEALAPLAKHAGPDTLVLTIAAGRSLQSIEAQLPERTSVIRAMPNTPAAIGRVAAARGEAAPGRQLAKRRDHPRYFHQTRATVFSAAAHLRAGHRSQQSFRVGMQRTREQRFHQRFLDLLAGVHDDHPPGRLGDDTQIVGDQNHRRAQLFF